ncbi:MAG TPA: c-type cytochrome [Casimicrobiaceae bacterium]|nr:c-type cytochrome [Casimicrobiaceae bacterium]
MNARRAIACACATALVALLPACERERRDFHQPPSASTVVKSLRMSEITPGGGDAPPQAANPLEENAYAVSEGKRLFSWYNCNGCHADGGGGSGPALMDDVWIYGSAPANVFATIVQGRPNGMPSFGGRIPENQVWQLVAYVRSLSGQVSKNTAPSRNDALMTKPAENRMDKATPVQATPSSASEHP